MKNITFVAALLLLLSQVSIGQRANPTTTTVTTTPAGIPIAGLPTQLGKPAAGWIPISVSGVTKKIDINALASPARLQSLSIDLRTSSPYTASNHQYIRFQAALPTGSSIVTIQEGSIVFQPTDGLDKLYTADYGACQSNYFYDLSSGFIYLCSCYALSGADAIPVTICYLLQ